MMWEKLGRIYDPAKLAPEGFGYGANPFPMALDDHVYRIFFNNRDAQNRSYITYVDFDMDTMTIVNAPQRFLVAPGAYGLFDDCGCSLGCVLKESDDCWYIYYLGWNLLKTVPWMNYIGLAIYSPKTGACKKYADVPILERNAVDALSTSYPYVRKTDAGYQMWYGSNLAWGATERDMNHVIKYATSQDGIHWDRTGIVCIREVDERAGGVNMLSQSHRWSWRTGDTGCGMRSAGKNIGSAMRSRMTACIGAERMKKAG